MPRTRAIVASMDSPCFDNPNDEASYWKQMAQEYLSKLQDARDEFDEFQQGSHELEAELEVQLEEELTQMEDMLAAATDEEMEGLPEISVLS